MSENTGPIPYPKHEWRPGEWQTEPDRKDFIHAGFACFALRNMHGNWCGYVGVPSSHPYYGKSEGDMNVNVHGGVTYTEKCSGNICHVPQPGMPDDVWWIGFDTAHYMDWSPSKRMSVGHDEVYKNLAYVEAEIRDLAEQLQAVGADPRD